MFIFFFNSSLATIEKTSTSPRKFLFIFLTKTQLSLVSLFLRPKEIPSHPFDPTFHNGQPNPVNRLNQG